MCYGINDDGDKREGINWAATISFLFVVVFWMVVVIVIQGCSMKGVLTDKKATIEDCIALQSYIELCDSELAKEHMNPNARKIWELTLAGAEIELARKCAGVILPKPTKASISPTVADPIPDPAPVPNPEVIK